MKSTFSFSRSSTAFRLVAAGLNSVSRTTSSTFRPRTPPSALISSIAISTPACWSIASIA